MQLDPCIPYTLSNLFVFLLAVYEIIIFDNSVLIYAAITVKRLALATDPAVTLATAVAST